MTRDELDISNIVNIYAPGKVSKARHGRHNTNIANYIDDSIAGAVGSDLQSVTDKGNITTAPIIVGTTGRNITISAVTADGQFIIAASSEVNDGETIVTESFETTHTLNSIGNNNVIYGFNGDQWMILKQNQDSEQAGIVFNKRVQLPEAINDNEAPTFGQVKGAVAVVADQLAEIIRLSVKNIFITASSTGDLESPDIVNRTVLKIDGPSVSYLAGVDFTKSYESTTIVMTNQELVPTVQYLITLA